MSHQVIVIGAGHNGLVAAILLARRGRRVALVERREQIGGRAAGDVFLANYPGAGLLHDTTGVRPDVARELRLADHGLTWRDEPPHVLALGSNGDRLVLGGAPERRVEQLRPRFPRDASRLGDYEQFLDRVRPVLRRQLHDPPLDLVGLDRRERGDLLRRAFGLRRIGRVTMMELLRVLPMPVADWLGEWFETDLLRAALALPAVAGEYAGPRSPGTTANLLLGEAGAGPGVRGGASMLIHALGQAAAAAGVEILTGVGVDEVLCDAEGVHGVRLDDGRELRSDIVAGACSVRQLLLDLVPAGALTSKLEQRMLHFRCRGTTSQVLFVLDRRPDLGVAEPVEVVRIGGRLDDLEQAFDAVKYRAVAERPILEMHLPSIAPDPTPPGHAVASVLVHFTPHDLEGGWDSTGRDRLGEIVQRRLEEHLPGLANTIIGREVLAPPDLEARYGLTGGQIHHGELALDQRLVRPVPECSGYGTPIPGLYLCGSGTHPGGGLSCGPGALAARAILARPAGG